ncbi:hypothetical protein THRCLA_00006 [Thraustotheca clavata]|uniref:E2F-associated phosphoprotein n=1 Tax=Thraustotheca clavata TaxID=74557 RepID=A0A1W0ACK3_9STRA|nr:hypothetical protein THRCLA_00006 [Thraustotheca clavata]
MFDAKMAALMAALDAVDLSREKGELKPVCMETRHFEANREVVEDDVEESKHKDVVMVENEKGNDVEQDELYNEQEDDQDAAYVNQHLRGTIDEFCDAALSCPSCFVTVCYASERHERYETQYRAKKAVNCRILEETHERVNGNDKGTYHSVVCSDCGAIVGLKAPQEHHIHFFHVLPSHS